jgi:hypothetical protein
MNVTGWRLGRSERVAMSLLLILGVIAGGGAALLLLGSFALVKRDSEQMLTKYVELLGESRIALAEPDEEATAPPAADNAPIDGALPSLAAVADQLPGQDLVAPGAARD